MPEFARLSAQIEVAASHLTPAWPLRSFIAANPLSGFEERGFEEAARDGAALFGGRALPDAALLKAALADGRIDSNVLAETAKRHGRPQAARPAALDVPPVAWGDAAPSAVNRVMIRWLAAFLDEGQAAWPMPGRERGFWRAFRDLARHDEEIPGRKSLATLPDDPLRTVAKLLDGVPEAAREALLTRHLAALPGWAGHVKWRAAERGHPYAKAAPATLVDYLAVRLFLADAFGEAPTAAPAPATAEAAAIWLEAWEESWRGRLTTALAAPRPAELPRMPAAQLVFCIDVRSEVLPPPPGAHRAPTPRSASPASSAPPSPCSPSARSMPMPPAPCC
jgi:uncharacterized protein YbcC (UPF0753/DUF2309 family)